MQKNNTYQSTPATASRTGALPYTLLNDYLFRAVFQERPKALEGLCRSMLHLQPQDTVHITLKNPIVLGKKIEDKEFLLDLALDINHSLYLNLEMQAYSQPFWKERSLSYACRSFDNLNHGERYDRIVPVVHIGFLNFTLFPDHPEFYAHYELENVKNHYKYSDKLRISVVNLKKIELATEEDQAYGIDLWARVLTATTWEEIEMLAQNNDYLQEAVSGVAQLTEDEQIRQLCQAREDYEYWERIRNAAHQRELAERDTTIAEQNMTIVNQQSQLTEKDTTIANQQNQLAEKDTTISFQQNQLAEKDTTISFQQNQLAENAATISSQLAELERLRAMLAGFTSQEAKTPEMD